MLEGLLPPSVIAVETRSDRLDVELFPEEELALGRAVAKRRREFTTGRACAREALARLGVRSTPIGSGLNGEPLWPTGIVGSITHCEGYRACAVAPARAVLAIGIDAERDARLSDGVWAEVAFGSELALRAATSPGPHLDAVLFSAKDGSRSRGAASASLDLEGALRRPPRIDEITFRERPPRDPLGRWRA